MRYIFFGTSDFALPSLEALLSLREYECLAVVTTPDKPVGRRQKLTPSPVKVFAESHKLPIAQPEKLKDYLSSLSNMKPDFGIVISYGKIIPEDVINVFPRGILNVHASILPRHRGASPIQSAILMGDASTGVTIMKIDAGMDTGPVLSNATISLSKKETAGELFAILSKEGSKLIQKTLPQYLDGSLQPQPQDDTLATYTSRITKEDGHIDWKRSADEIERQLRAFTPWPGVFSLCDEKRLRILRVDIHDAALKNEAKIGILEANNDQLFVQTGYGTLEILNLQREGKKPQTAAEFLRGNGQLLGKKLT